MKYKIIKLNEKPQIIGVAQPLDMKPVRTFIVNILNMVTTNNKADAAMIVALGNKLVSSQTDEMELSEIEAENLKTILDKTPMLATHKGLINSDLIIEEE